MISFPSILYVGAGGAIGSICRFLCSVYLPPLLMGKIPGTTFIVNILGSVLIGCLFAWQHRANSDTLYLLGMVGFCGGFTTFSTFSLEQFKLIQSGQISMALLYALLSVSLCMLGTFIGWIIFKTS